MKINHIISWVTNIFNKRRSARELFKTSGSNFSIGFFGAVAGILAARMLGPEGRGTLAAAVVWVTLFRTIISFGLPQALTFFTARDPSSQGKIFRTSLRILLIQCIVILPLGWLIITQIFARIHPDSSKAVLIYLLTLPFSLLIGYLTTIAQGMKNFNYYNIVRVISAAGRAGSLVLVGLFGLRDPESAVIFLTASQVVIALLALLAFTRFFDSRGSYERGMSRQLLGYGIKAYPGDLSSMANGRLDQFVMSIILGVQDLGLYAVAVSYATILFPVSQAFAVILFPAVAGSRGGMATSKIRRFFLGNLLVSACVALLMGISAPVLIPLLFGVVYEPSVYPAVILLLAAIFLGSIYVLSEGARGLGYPIIPSIAEVVGVVVTITGLVLVLEKFGIIGAAYVSTISYGVTMTIIAVGIILVLKRKKWPYEHDSETKTV